VTSTIGGGAKGLYLNHVIREKMGVDNLCKKKAEKTIIVVKYTYTKHVIVII
jgi:hypothetical protein